MKNLQFFLVILLSFSVTRVWGAVDDDANQKFRDNFPASGIAQLIKNEPERFAAIQTLATELIPEAEGEIEKLTQQMHENPSAQKMRMMRSETVLKSLFACGDINSYLQQISKQETTSIEASFNYNMSMRYCLRAMQILRGYFTQHQQAMMDMQKLPQMLNLPRNLDTKSLQASYINSIDQRYDVVIAELSNSEKEESNKLNSALPSKPFQYNWNEMELIRASVSDLIQRYDQDNKPRLNDCRKIVETPKSATVSYFTINEWLTSCAKKIAIANSGHLGSNLKDFSDTYKSGLKKFENDMQKANLEKMPALPAQPYQFNPKEILMFKQYMLAASQQSLNLLAGIETIGKDGQIFIKDVCGSTDPTNLKSDLNNGLVKSNWTSLVNRLQNCGKFIKLQNEPAGTRLLNSLDAYMNALNNKQSQPIFR